MQKKSKTTIVTKGSSGQRQENKPHKSMNLEFAEGVIILARQKVLENKLDFDPEQNMNFIWAEVDCLSKKIKDRKLVESHSELQIQVIQDLNIKRMLLGFSFLDLQFTVYTKKVSKTVSQLGSSSREENRLLTILNDNLPSAAIKIYYIIGAICSNNRSNYFEKYFLRNPRPPEDQSPTIYFKNKAPEKKTSSTKRAMVKKSTTKKISGKEKNK